MKKAEDFRKAFGPATPGFESVVKKTMKELRAQEVKPAVKEWRRWRRPVFAMAMALVLFVGFVAVSGSLNPFSRTDRIRSEEEGLYTAQPITTVLSMGAGQEEGDGDGAESGMPEGADAAAENDESETDIRDSINNFFIGWAHTPGQVMCYFTTDWYTRGEEFQEILGNKKPVSYQIEKITGQEGDPVVGIPIDGPSQPVPESEPVFEPDPNEYFYRHLISGSSAFSKTSASRYPAN